MFIVVYLDDGSKSLPSVFSYNSDLIPRIGDQVQFDGGQYWVRQVYWLLPTDKLQGEVRLEVQPVK